MPLHAALALASVQPKGAIKHCHGRCLSSSAAVSVMISQCVSGAPSAKYVLSQI
jgi:hypothetical protein